MKKHLILLLTAVFIFSMFGCAAKEIISPQVTPAVKPVSILNAVIAEKSGSTLLLAGIDEDAAAGDLYTVPVTESITGSDGKAADASALHAGMTIAVEYDGTVAESFPAQIPSAKSISIISDGSNLIGFYRSILNELYASDEGLNSGIETLAFDFSALGNLRDSEKAALMKLVAEDIGLDYTSGSYDELCAQGLIDKAGLFFPTGVLITVKTSDESAEGFTFDISKWRGGDGAIGSDGNRASLKDTMWVYSPGGSWIS